MAVDRIKKKSISSYVFGLENFAYLHYVGVHGWVIRCFHALCPNGAQSNGGTGAVDLEKNVGSLKTALQKVRDESSETDWYVNPMH